MNKEKVKRILDAFDDMYPDAQCELVHHNELELLICSYVIGTNNRCQC